MRPRTNTIAPLEREWEWWLRSKGFERCEEWVKDGDVEVGLMEYYPQYLFDGGRGKGGRDWRNDYCFPALGIVVEFEGGAWMKKGGHTTGGGFTRNIDKYNAISDRDWLLYRVNKRRHLASPMKKIEERLGKVGDETEKH